MPKTTTKKKVVAEKSVGDELLSSLLGETYVEDSLPKNESLAEHDKKKHPDGFDPKTDTCKFREKIATETETDKADEVSSDRGGQANPSNTDTKPKVGGISRIFTGSAANYDKPSLLKVGTGEGSQVFGWGLYGSTEKGVAEGYARTGVENAKRHKYITSINGRELGSTDTTKEGLAAQAFNAIGDREGAIELLRRRIENVGGGSTNYVGKLKSAIEILSDENNEVARTKSGNRRETLYEQTFFTDREPGDESHLLKWYGKVPKRQKAWIKSQAEKEGVNVSNLIWDGGEIQGAMLYSYLATPSYFGSPKAASEFLARAGIDGIKYPVDSFGGKTVKNGDKAGWNYVSFRDDNIRIDKKYVDGQKMYDYQELMAKHHSNIDPMEVLSHLTKLDTPEEMAAEFSRIMESGKIEKDKTVQDELVEALVMDADTLKDQTLQEHDRIHHKDGYHKGDTCKFRDKMKEETPEDQADALSLGKGNSQSSKDNKQQVKLTDLTNRIKGFIKGVKIRFSETPYQEDGREVRKSIRESEQKNWNKILDAFENKTAGADATFHHQLLDHTPAVYQRLGVQDLPITIRGGIIHKMIGNIRNSEYDYHEIPISELRNLLIDLDNPVAVFDSKSDPNAFVVLTNILDKHGNLKAVVPLKLERDTSGKAKENAIASGYGQKTENMQNWIDEGYLRYVSKKALKKSAQRLQLPGDSILRAKGVLMENDFSSEQLGDIIPDSGADVKGGDEKKVEVGEVINFRDSIGEVVGTYNRKTNEMVVYPGADSDTIGHELCGHATWQYAEQQARKGDSRLLEKMQEVVDAPAAKPVWDEVKANYEGEDRAVQREEVWAHIIGHQTSKAIEEIQKSRSGRRWYQKFWNVVKDAWKGLLATVRINSVHLEGTEEMSPKEFSEYIVKQMLEGKTLGNISKEGGGEEGAERKSIRSKSIVSPEEDAAYMAAVEKGDVETASRMVREVAGRYFPNTKVLDKDGLPKIVYHGGNFRKYETVPDLGPGEMHFGTKKAAQERVAYKYQGMEDSVSIDGYFLNLENPKRMEDIGGDSIWLDYGNEEDRKYDGVIYKNESEDKGEDSYGISWEPSRIKSADPVTYDDKGNVIPLSRRFDDGDDIRGDVSGKTEYIEKMKSLHPDFNPEELIDRLKNLGSREEMETEVSRILGKK